METIQLLNVTPEQLQNAITKEVKSHLDKLFENLKTKQPDEYLSRKDVAKLFKVDISTIHNWCKSNKLKPLGIGSRVYFLRSDIEQSLKPLNS